MHRKQSWILEGSILWSELISGFEKEPVSLTLLSHFFLTRILSISVRNGKKVIFLVGLFLEFGCAREGFVVNHEAQERLPIPVCRVHYCEREVIFPTSRV